MKSVRSRRGATEAVVGVLVGIMQDKMEPSEQLGDLLRQAGDADAALACYQKANVPSKVIEGLAAKGDFTTLSQYAGASVRFPANWIL